MYKMAEDFFTSLGFEPMTSTFWNKSVLFKPSDRKVDCHGSASDFMTHDDYRLYQKLHKITNFKKNIDFIFNIYIYIYIYIDIYIYIYMFYIY